jgi:hypothetical protein
MIARIALTGVVALVSALAVTSPAAADSIAYVKDGDVWLAASDGGRQYRVTQTGGYSDVSQADDGTMIALFGVRLHRLSPTGTVLADFDTPVSDTRPPGSKAFHGPFDPAISPDGRRVAYTYYYVANSQNQSCFPPTCFTASIEGGTGYSHADRQTAWDEPGLGRHSGWLHPSWLGNDDVMLSEPTHAAFNHDVITDTLGDSGVPVKDWFSDLGTTRLGAGDVTREGTKLAFQGGDGDGQMRVMAMQGAPPAKPAVCYLYDAPAGRFSAPTWAPGGARLAWSDDEGVKVVDVPDFSGGCTTDGASPSPRLIVPGGREPDWGPAGVPPPRPAGSGPVGTAPTGAGSAAPGARAGGVRVRVVRATRRTALLRVQTPGAGRLSATARLGRKVVGRARPRRVTTRPAALRLTFTPAGRRLLARARARSVRVTVVFSAMGGTSRRAVVRVPLGRR